MESNAAHAIEIGVNVFIFIIALTSSLLLFTNVLNMSEYANKIVIDTTESTLMEMYGDTEERIYTGDEVLAIISSYSETIIDSDIEDNIPQFRNVILKLDGNQIDNTQFNFKLTALTKSYNLEYLGKDAATQKQVYNFKSI